MKKNTYFYKDKPIFGLDIGHSTVKVLQLDLSGGDNRVVGFGVGEFDPKAIKENAIVDFDSISESINQIFKSHLVGKINTNRVAICVPSARTYTRSMVLPSIKSSEIDQAVRLEAEQYIPAPIDELYMDYSMIGKDEKEIELLAVGVPKKIVDSYLQLTHILGLEAVVVDSSITAAGRLFQHQDVYRDIPCVLIDFGSKSADITVHDETIIVTGTIPGGGDNYTNQIAKGLGVTQKEAHIIKSKYGLNKSKKQAEILKALKPSLDQLSKEIKRMIRYHDERSGSKKKIGQIITMGGGANMPGLSEYLTNMMYLPTRMYDPWVDMKMGRLKKPTDVEKSMFITVAGLAMIDSKELFS